MAKRKSTASTTIETHGADGPDPVLAARANAPVHVDETEPIDMNAGRGVGELVVEVDPDLIIIDPAVKSLRRWDGTSQQELRIPELARTISEEGQIEPCIVRETDDGYVLVAGHRRHAAVSSLRAAGEDVMLQCIVRQMDENTAFRNACLENIQSEDFTGIEFGALCRTLRERYKKAGWDKKGSGTAAVAEHLGVSPATVTTHEKLLDLPPGVQDDVQSGRLSVNAALELAGVEDEARPDVLDKAKQLADADADKRARNEEKRQRIAQERVSGRRQVGVAGGKKTAPQTAEENDARAEEAEVAEAFDNTASPTKPVKPTAPPKPAKVTGKHIRQAAKSVQGEKARLKAPKMGEAIDLFEGFICALYPAAMVDLCKAFSEWGHGRITDKAVEKVWDKLAESVRKDAPMFKPDAETVDEKVDKAYRKAGVRGGGKKVAVKKAGTGVKPASKPKSASKSKQKPAPVRKKSVKPKGKGKR